MPTSDAPGGWCFDVVVPTVGRPSLAALVQSLCHALPATARLILVDDRPGRASLVVPADPRVVVVTTGGRGPAAARNAGWRRSTAPWVVFLDDDVDVPLDWVRRLEDDLESVASADAVAAVQGRVRVPLPTRRAPSDWERNVQGLEDAPWIAADLAVRRSALAAVGGFDERFPRAYREDSDFALRLLDGGWELELGGREVRHPVRPAPWWVSLDLQRGNADDVLIERLHGRDWRARLGAAQGSFAAHRITVALGLAALVATGLGRRRIAALAGAGWLLRTARFAWSRIAPGPRTAREVAAITATSVLIPPAACVHRLGAHVRMWTRRERS